VRVLAGTEMLKLQVCTGKTGGKISQGKRVFVFGGALLLTTVSCQ
jgi:hypothetical protein